MMAGVSDRPRRSLAENLSDLSSVLADAADKARKADIIRMGVEHCVKLVGYAALASLVVSARAAKAFGAQEESFLQVAALVFRAA
jgi:hypothetical protein